MIDHVRNDTKDLSNVCPDARERAGPGACVSSSLFAIRARATAHIKRLVGDHTNQPSAASRPRLILWGRPSDNLPVCGGGGNTGPARSRASGQIKCELLL